MNYEIHVTVQCEDHRIEEFRTACQELGVKPIVIDMENNGEHVLRDVMTSHRVKSESDDWVIDSAHALAFALKGWCFEPTRVKVEAAPDHPLAPTTQTQAMPKGCYWETHIPLTTKTDKYMDVLQNVCNKSKAHLSWNAFKRHTDGSFVQMATLRVHTGPRYRFDKMRKKFMESLGLIFPPEVLVVGTPEVEFTIYDTDVNHDSVWTV